MHSPHSPVEGFTLHDFQTDQYLKRRSGLIATDRSLRRDTVHYAKATINEQAADAFVRSVRQDEASSIWSVPHENTPNVYPGMEFLTAKKVIDETQLFRLVKKMPKGALLHCHLDATVDAQSLLRIALKHPAVCVRAKQPLTSQSLESILPEFHPLSAAELEKITATSLTDNSYKPGSWVRLTQARENFSTDMGGITAFDRWVINALSINPSEAYVTHTSVDRIWKKFESTFEVAEQLTFYKPIFIDYIREMFRQAIEDGIMYIEARIMFFNRVFIGADAKEDVTHATWVKIFETVVEEIKEELKGLDRSDEFLGAKIIYSTMRCITPTELEWYMHDCIALKKEFPHLIAGFDLVGPENTMFPLLHYIDPLLRFKDWQKEAGVDIPYIFHAGETLGDGNSVDDNLYDAVLLGTKRIGHGFSMSKHPSLMQLCREQGIALEVCPISNEILRLTGSMPMHPLPVFLNNGVPVALCSDDPGVFGHMGLSYDYFQVLVSSEITGLITLAVMAKDSIEFSMLNDTEKKQAFAMWGRRWHLFIEDVVLQASHYKNS